MSRHPETPESIAASVCPDLVSGVISSPRRKGGEGGTGVPERIRIRRITDAKGTSFQLESLRGAQAFQENIDPRELETRLQNLLGATYSRAEFTLTGGTIQVLANRRGELTAIRKESPAERTSAPGTDCADTPRDSAAENSGHNLTKNYILPEGEPVPFLVDLGVMDAEGRVIRAKYDKFRQINRFLEFIADIVPDLAPDTAAPDTAAPDAAREISIIDFGCGKSYLTFAVYQYLHVLRGLPVRITGLDLKEDVIARCSLLAEKYGFEGLSFRQGDIAGFTPDTPPDMVISLHACDTATDLALAQALRWNSRVILSVPCCQHELNTLLSRPAGAGPAREALAGAFKFGIIRERLSALFTDVRRAEILESRGYRVQILEFIDMSHTPKNLLIRAVRRNDPADAKPSGNGRSVLGDFLGEKLTLERQLEFELDDPRVTGVE